ncbi:hypothetical protein LINGRAHAP2_LOCUS13414 [Linum grandiflorum]
MAYAYFPDEVEEKIVKEHLVNIRQLVSFSGVCRSWRSTAHQHFNIRRSYPGILVSKTSCPKQYCPEHDADCNYCIEGDPEHYCQHRTTNSNSSDDPHYQFRPIYTFFDSARSLVTPSLMRSTHDFRTRRWIHREEEEEEIDLEKCHCVASKDGWLVLIQRGGNRYPVRFLLLNPITGASIRLPIFPYIGEFYSKVILTSSPEKHHDCHLIVLSGCTTPQLAWCKARGGSWEYTRKDSKFFALVSSACYIRGKLYAVDTKGVHVFDNLINVTEEEDGVGQEDGVVPPHPPPTVRSLALPISEEYPSLVPIALYAMELNCQLIVVCRLSEGDSFTFKVYKLVATRNGQRGDSTCWTEVWSLDGHAAFLSYHHCFCVPIENKGMTKTDHIYYLNKHCGQCQLRHPHHRNEYDWRVWDGRNLDYDVFSLEDGKLVEQSRLPDKNYDDYTWFLPMPWDSS